MYMYMCECMFSLVSMITTTTIIMSSLISMVTTTAYDYTSSSVSTVRTTV